VHQKGRDQSRRDKQSQYHSSVSHIYLREQPSLQSIMCANTFGSTKQTLYTPYG